MPNKKFHDTKTLKRRSPGMANIGRFFLLAMAPLAAHGTEVMNNRVRGRRLSSPTLAPVHREHQRDLNIFQYQVVEKDSMAPPHGDLPQPGAPPHDAATGKGKGKGLIAGDAPLLDSTPGGKGKGGIGTDGGIYDSPLQDPLTGSGKGKGKGKYSGPPTLSPAPSVTPHPTTGGKGTGKGTGKGKGKGKYSGPPTLSPAPSVTPHPTIPPGSIGDSPTGGDSGTGGSPTDGGGSGTGGSPTDGGGSGTGGSPTDGGGSGTGGSPTDGGGSGTGGSPTDGGGSGTGGSPTDGGGSGTGGSPTDGGGSGTGGSPTDGGGSGTGGSPTDGGGSGTGGSPTDGGGSGTGGSPTDGGGSGTGGSPTDGGGSGTGGSPTDGDGGGTGGSPSDGDVNVAFISLDCDAIRSGTAPTTGDPLSFSVSMDLTILGGYDIESIMDALQKQLQEIVAPAVAGCPAATRRLIEMIRRLQSEIYNVVFGEGGVTGVGTCRPSVQSGTVPEGATCYDTVQNVDVYVNEGFEADDLEGKIEEEIAKLDLSVPGLLNIGNVGVVAKDDNGGASGIGAVTQRVSDDDGISAVGWIGIAAGGVAVLLILLMFAKSRKSSEHVEHVYLDEDDSEYLKEIDDETEIVSDVHSPNRTYLMEESDGSIASAWGLTEMRSPNYAQLGKFHSTMDVHNCNSATCQICAERNRNRDLQFVPTGPPPETPVAAPRMPARSVREYIAEDTVEL